MIGQEILQEIDSTLDQLIRNAEVIQNVDLRDLSKTEIEGFQKTQESLLQRLMHMDEFLVKKKEALRTPQPKSAGAILQEKRLRFEKLKKAYHKNMAESQPCNTAILLKRRSKKFLSEIRN
jgi:hypothetical protein